MNRRTPNVQQTLRSGDAGGRALVETVNRYQARVNRPEREMTFVRPVAWVAGVGLSVFLFGCSGSSPKGSDPPGGPPPGPPGGLPPQGNFDTESGPYAAGKKVLVANNCFRCHSVNGVR